MSAPRDRSSSTNSSCPPAQASVRAVSWLLSVSESTSMQEKGAWEHGVPGYEVPVGYCATPGHKISNYLLLITINIQTLTKRTALGFNKFICFRFSIVFPNLKLRMQVSNSLRIIYRPLKHFKFLDHEPETDKLFADKPASWSVILM